jgi:cell division protein FtsW
MMKSIVMPQSGSLLEGMTPKNLLLFSAGSLLCIGLIMVASASMGVSAASNEGFPYSFLIKHTIFLTVGFATSLAVFFVPTSFLNTHSRLILIVGIVAIAAVLVVGARVNGSIRWIRMGPLNAQPSEFTKLAVVIYLSSYLIRFQDEVRSRFSGFIKPMMVVGLVVFLLMMEPDFGASIVTVSAVMGMLFLAGVPFKTFISAGTFVVAMGVAAIVFEPYRLQRFLSFTDPWADQFNTGYQLAQSLIAFGRGDWFGVGLGNSVQKLSYLPEAHTDFVLAVYAEEFGLMGMFFLIFLFWLLVNSAIKIGQKAECVGHLYGAYMAYGISLIIGVQALVNIGVNMGLLPTKGLTLPLVSYGGSSLVIVLAMLAILLRIDNESQAMSTASKKRGRP